MNTTKILVVDDDMDVIFAMKTILESGGHTVVTAENGEEGFARFTECNPDVIFLDLMMESIDAGIETCKKIRERDKKVRIYLLSSVGDETAMTLDIQSLGFNGAMSKPITPAELLGLVRE